MPEASEHPPGTTPEPIRDGASDGSHVTDHALAQDAGSGSTSRSRLDIPVLALLSLVLRLPAYFSSVHLTFDDGTFASSVLAMRDGGVPFREVFSSQGPLFLPLAYVFDFIGLRSINGPRTLGVVSGVVATIASYWILRRIADRPAALVGGALIATSGCLMWVSAPLAADGPALAFALLAFAVAVAYNRRPTLSLAVLMGAAVGATLSVKAMEAPILVPVLAVLAAPLLDRGSPRQVRFQAVRDTIAAGLTSLVLFLAVSLPFGLADVWDQSFTYRTDAATHREPLANAAKIVSTMWDRDLVLLLFGAAAIGWAIWSARQASSAEPTTNADRGTADLGAADRGSADQGTDEAVDEPLSARRPTDRFLVVSWAAFSALWLIFMVSPMWRPHVSAMVPPLALLVALYRPPMRVVYLLGLVSIPLLFIQLDGLVVTRDYSPSEARAIEVMREMPEGAWAISDEPGLIWRAGRRTTDDLVDPSMLRVQQGRYDENSIVEAASLTQVCAVVVRSNQRFGHFPGLGDRLSDIGYEVVATSTNHAGDDQRVYLKSGCSPPG